MTKENLVFAQLIYRDSLRDIEACLRARPSLLYQYADPAQRFIARARKGQLQQQLLGICWAAAFWNNNPFECPPPSGARWPDNVRNHRQTAQPSEEQLRISFPRLFPIYNERQLVLVIRQVSPIAVSRRTQCVKIAERTRGTAEHYSLLFTRHSTEPDVHRQLLATSEALLCVAILQRHSVTSCAIAMGFCSFPAGCGSVNRCIALSSVLWLWILLVTHRIRKCHAGVAAPFALLASNGTRKVVPTRVVSCEEFGV